MAREILTAYQNDQIIIVRHASQKFSVNWLAAALFTESCFLQSRTEAVVFKTEDYDGAIAAYKPFVALTIGIKYVIRLYQEDFKNMYKDIASLSYLKLSIKEDYLANQLIIKLDKGGETKKIHAATAEEALTAIGIWFNMSIAVSAKTRSGFDKICGLRLCGSIFILQARATKSSQSIAYFGHINCCRL